MIGSSGICFRQYSRHILRMLDMFSGVGGTNGSIGEAGGAGGEGRHELVDVRRRTHTSHTVRTSDARAKVDFVDLNFVARIGWHLVFANVQRNLAHIERL